jgi:hypothetical protein
MSHNCDPEFIVSFLLLYQAQNLEKKLQRYEEAHASAKKAFDTCCRETVKLIKKRNVARATYEAERENKRGRGGARRSVIGTLAKQVTRGLTMGLVSEASLDKLEVSDLFHNLSAVVGSQGLSH